MFNLKHHKVQYDGPQLLESELSSFDIVKEETGTYSITIGDENLHASSLDESLDLIEAGIKEIKTHLWEKWQELSDLSEVILQNDGGNEGSIDNLLFLSNVKKTYILSTMFSDLEELSSHLRELFNIDIVDISDALITRFNHDSLYVRLLHRLVMREIYRTRLINRYKRITKQAQISGPWANLDLPMKERVWEWDEGESEYFGDRQKQKREQVRYNPENLKSGFFYVWQDLTRDPYKFEDMKKDSPYKSRLLMQIP